MGRGQDGETLLVRDRQTAPGRGPVCPGGEAADAGDEGEVPPGSPHPPSPASWGRFEQDGVRCMVREAWRGRPDELTRTAPWAGVRRSHRGAAL